MKMTYSDATVKYRRLTLGLIIEMYCIVGDNRSPWLRISGRWCESHHFKSKAKPVFRGERMLEIPIIEKFSKRPALFAAKRQTGDFFHKTLFCSSTDGAYDSQLFTFWPYVSIFKCRSSLITRGGTPVATMPCVPIGLVLSTERPGATSIWA